MCSQERAGDGRYSSPITNGIIRAPILGVDLRHACNEDSINWSLLRRDKLAIVAHHQWLRVTRLPNMRCAYALRTEVGKHAPHVRYRESNDIVAGRTEHRVASRQVAREVNDVTPAGGVGLVEIGVLDNADKRKRRVVHIHPVKLGEASR